MQIANVKLFRHILAIQPSRLGDHSLFFEVGNQPRFAMTLLFKWRLYLFLIGTEKLHLLTLTVSVSSLESFFGNSPLDSFFACAPLEVPPVKLSNPSENIFIVCEVQEMLTRADGKDRWAIDVKG